MVSLTLTTRSHSKQENDARLYGQTLIMLGTIRMRELNIILHYMMRFVVASARDLVLEMCAAIILPLPL
jgi:hypothetical protein